MVDSHGGTTVATLRCKSEKTLCGVATLYRSCIIASNDQRILWGTHGANLSI